MQYLHYRSKGVFPPRSCATSVFVCFQARAAAAEEQVLVLQEQHGALCERLREAAAQADAQHQKV
jgi:hypothetical protein